MKLSKMLEWCTTVKYEIFGRASDYVIRHKGDTAYILFKGSDSLKNELKWSWPTKSSSVVESNLFCQSKLVDHWCKINFGVRSDLSKLTGANPKIKKVVCVGFGHGGALAQICALWFQSIYGNKFIIKGYSFGSPRVFSTIIPERVYDFTKNLTVIINREDIITRLPMKVFGYDYISTSKLIDITPFSHRDACGSHSVGVYMDALRRYERFLKVVKES